MVAMVRPATADTFTRVGLMVRRSVGQVSCCEVTRSHEVRYLGTARHRDTITFITPPETHPVTASARPTPYSG